jgi:hypothetical protein
MKLADEAGPPEEEKKEKKEKKVKTDKPAAVKAKK